MFDINEFKKKVKEWMIANPQGELQDLIDYCEELIPSQQFSTYKWLVDQTTSWYRNIQSHREAYSHSLQETDDIC